MMRKYIITVISFLLKPVKRKLIIFNCKLTSKTGLEIGGPSSIFGLKGYFPVYVFAKRVDSVNYSTETIWEGKIAEGKNFNYFKSKKGYQYIQEASELKDIALDSYDFLLSSHSLEHIANPIKALKKWHTLLKSNGQLVLILPDKKNTFDIKRPYTSMEHLINDYKQDTDEHDDTHFDEILLHFFPPKIEEKISKEMTKELLQKNYENRRAHHHVFSFEIIREMLVYCGFETIYQQEAPPFHLITIAKKI